MKMRDFLERWGLSGLRIKLPFLEGEFAFSDPDRGAAWDLYVELLTRVAVQPLPDDAGSEQSALDSVYELFGLTRETLKRHGPGCAQFAKLAIPVLNQIVRPFAAKWHACMLAGQLNSAEVQREFRTELATLQCNLQRFTQALASMAQVEDLTTLETASG